MSPLADSVSPCFTLRAVLVDKPNAEGKLPIKIRITISGKHTYITTGLRVKPDRWKEGRVQGIPNSALYNQRINKKYTELEALLLRENPASIGELKRLLSGGAGNGSFVAYAEEVLPVLRNEKSGKPIAPETARRWGYDLAHIRNYAPALTWSEVTPQWLRNFNKHLLNMKYEDGRHRMEQNSARKTFVFMRRIFNEAIRDGITTNYPFKDWKIPGETEKPTQYLTIEETDRIKALLDRTDLSPAMRTTIAHFLLECYSGIRHSDWSRWQTERLSVDESFYLTTTKNRQPIYLPLKDSPRLLWIVNYIRDNNLSYTYSNQDANRTLKTVGMLAGIGKNLTTHVGRRTAGTLLLEKGFSRETVAEVLGVSVKVVHRYAKITRRKVAGEYEKLGGL